ncbi:unnamed protein product, partial [Ostreobium quekettii]
MGLQGYVGNSQDVTRIRRQQKQREEQKKKFEELRNQSKAKLENAGLRRFGAGSSEVLDTAFKRETVGLVTREEFMQKRSTIEERIEEAENRRLREEHEKVLAAKEERKRKRAKLAAQAKLSFAGEEDEESEEHGSDGQCDGGEDDANGGVKRPRFAKYGKDPAVETNFLPDADRELEEAELREKLKQ